MNYQAYQWQTAEIEFFPVEPHKLMSPQNSPKTEERSVINSFLKILPLAQWLLTILIAIAVFAISQRDSQTAQAQSIEKTTIRVENLETYIEKRKLERDKQFDEIQRSMLSREVFDAYHSNDVQRMERMEKMLQQILEDKNRK